ncbi:NAD(P)H-dependent oxidoreductase [Candidatus Dependentiae bacterium]|nr:NAD(P)H-dependent oxidoreductase [Candidatus Dependentiae bacterium]
MRIYAIFANDNITGTSYKAYQHAIKTLKEQSHTIDELLLYDKINDIPFFKHDRSYMESHSFYLENKNHFMQADMLLIVFPLFWYSVPGILKTWIDMINNWAYHYESGSQATPLHHIKKAIIIYTSMQSHHSEEKISQPVEMQFLETFKFIGIFDVLFYNIDNVSTINQEKLKHHLEQIEKLCQSCKS